MDARITIRLGVSQLAKLDALARSSGSGSRSMALRRLIEDTDVPSLRGGNLDEHDLSRDDLIGLLEEQARSGSLPAIRELLHRKEQEDELGRLRDLTAG